MQETPRMVVQDAVLAREFRLSIDLWVLLCYQLSFIDSDAGEVAQEFRNKISCSRMANLQTVSALLGRLTSKLKRPSADKVALDSGIWF